LQAIRASKRNKLPGLLIKAGYIGICRDPKHIPGHPLQFPNTSIPGIPSVAVYSFSSR
jgi:hypothetical protein